MNRNFSFALAIGALSFTTTAVAQQPAAVDPARTDSVVQQAMRSYQTVSTPCARAGPSQPGTASGNLREIRLEEAVSLALEKNLDIQVAKLEPQSLDFLVAGFRNTYRPVSESTVGLRDQYQLPNSTLSGGQPAVNNGTTPITSVSRRTSTSGAAATPSTGRNSRLETSNTFSTFNPSFHHQPRRGLRAAAAARIQDRQHPPAVADQHDQPRHLRRQRAGNGRSRRWPTCAMRIGTWSSRKARSTSRSAPPNWPTSWSKTTRRASKSARSRRSTSCRRRPRRPPAVRTWPPPKRPPRPPSSR